jgi:hypothetical protein
MAYFKYFPTIDYDIRGEENQVRADHVTNILARVLVKCHGWSDPDGSAHEALLATCEYLKHHVTDWERPDTLAHKYYGDSELHWIVLFANGNKIQYPWYDWPITQHDLTKFVTKKYGAANINGTHHYEDSDGYQVDSTAATAAIITNFKHEETVNDAKRTIRIMQPQYVDLVVDEFKRLMAQQ